MVSCDQDILNRDPVLCYIYDTVTIQSRREDKVITLPKKTDAHFHDSVLVGIYSTGSATVFEVLLFVFAVMYYNIYIKASVRNVH